MSISLNKPSYSVKCSTEGGGEGDNGPKTCPHGLWMIPEGVECQSL